MYIDKTIHKIQMKGGGACGKTRAPRNHCKISVVGSPGSIMRVGAHVLATNETACMGFDFDAFNHFIKNKINKEEKKMDKKSFEMSKENIVKELMAYPGYDAMEKSLLMSMDINLLTDMLNEAVSTNAEFENEFDEELEDDDIEINENKTEMNEEETTMTMTIKERLEITNIHTDGYMTKEDIAAELEAYGIVMSKKQLKKTGRDKLVNMLIKEINDIEEGVDAIMDAANNVLNNGIIKINEDFLAFMLEDELAGILEIMANAKIRIDGLMKRDAYRELSGDRFVEVSCDNNDEDDEHLEVTEIKAVDNDALEVVEIKAEVAVTDEGFEIVSIKAVDGKDVNNARETAIRKMIELYTTQEEVRKYVLGCTKGGRHINGFRHYASGNKNKDMVSAHIFQSVVAEMITGRPVTNPDTGETNTFTAEEVAVVNGVIAVLKDKLVKKVVANKDGKNSIYFNAYTVANMYGANGKKFFFRYTQEAAARTGKKGVCYIVRNNKLYNGKNVVIESMTLADFRKLDATCTFWELC